MKSIVIDYGLSVTCGIKVAASKYNYPVGPFTVVCPICYMPMSYIDNILLSLGDYSLKMWHPRFFMHDADIEQYEVCQYAASLIRGAKT